MTDKAFFEQYRYDPDKDLLGCGGFGNVYRAYDYSGKRYVAMKISQVKDIFGRFTLLNEVELSKSIDDHVNVARYEFGLRVKLPFPVDYAIMAYYEDGNLDMLLRKRYGKLTDREYYDIVEGLLEGIAHLHTENVIHRDLKLANILMHRTKQGQWRPKIADFGLSRQIDDTDASVANSAIGMTIAYAAPEQIENRPIRTNVDLWAIGVIIYRLLTGDMPFTSTPGVDATSANLEMSRKITQVELPERLNTIPEPYQSIIRRCFVKDIRDRAQTAHELLTIIKPFKPDGHSSNSPFNTTTTTTTTSEPISARQHYGVFADKSSNKLAHKSAPKAEIIPPSVSEPVLPVISEKQIEDIEEGTKLDIEPIHVEEHIAEGETLIDPFSEPKAQPIPVSKEETLIEPQSAPKSTPVIVSREETLIEPQSAPKATPSHVVSKEKSQPAPQNQQKSKPKAAIAEGATLIEPKSKAKNIPEEGATLIEPTVASKSTPLSKTNKSRVFVGGGLVALLLSFGICKMVKPADATAAVDASTTTATAAITPPADVSTSNTATVPSGQPTTVASPAAAVPTTTATTPVVPKVDPKTGKDVPVVSQPKANNNTQTAPSNSTPTTTVYVPPSTNNDAAKAAAEQKRKEDEARLAEQKRKEDEDKKRKEDEDKKRREEEDKRKNQPPPTLVAKSKDIFSLFKCQTPRCCAECPKHGVITIRNFSVDEKGNISVDANSNASISNPECKQNILEAFKKHYKFSAPKYAPYEFKTFDITF
jgi:serine/threonine protein kinase